MKKNVKNNIPVIIFVLLIILGFAIMCYPTISNAIHRKNHKIVIEEYKKDTSASSKEDKKRLLEEAKAYNDKLTSKTITDVFTNPEEETSKEYLDILNTGKDGVIAYISIPKIEEELPIYHGTSTKTLEKGVGHLEGSSFPIGGENTHTVLSAHRGLPSARLFTDLDQLEEKDRFYIHILDQKLVYEVEEISIIEPSETEKLTLADGEDYVTLVTCHPYGINTHRLLVRGKRVIEKAKIMEEKPVIKQKGISDIAFDIAITFALALIISLIVFIISCKKEEKYRGNKEIEVI